FKCLLTITSASHVVSVTKFQISSCSDRQAPGFICYDCYTAAVCVKVGNSWETVLVESCNTAEGLYCNEFEGGCSAAVGSCNPLAADAFECNVPGVYPDPFNCRLYHMCFLNGNNPVAISMDCGGAAFSPATGDCSLPLNDTSCQTPQFNCDFAGQMNAWPGNNNIYYICAVEPNVNGNRVLRPRLYRCPPNEMFQDGRCVQRDWSNLPPGSIIPYECERVGLFPDHTHCRYYYACNADLVAERIQCPDGAFFNPSILACVLGSC
ncbi:uncharacterized protein LOC125955498, partial [Anopheles darlingi]|uniref:uncharacterized protein LOC125955498 n=1 Tax=Anopheles darlingi TaxID=43151 RepID=UPI002100471A